MGKSVSVYIQDEELFEQVKDSIESGEYRNMSHAVEEGLSSLSDEP